MPNVPRGWAGVDGQISHTRPHTQTRRSTNADAAGLLGLGVSWGEEWLAEGQVALRNRFFFLSRTAVSAGDACKLVGVMM